MTDVTKKNIWQRAKSEKLIEAMRLCGCDKKFVDGTASDYECLCELLNVSHKLRGHEALDSFINKINRSTVLALSYDELTVENARVLWAETGEKQVSHKNTFDENIVEKYNFYKNTFVLNDVEKHSADYGEFIDVINNDILKEYDGVLVRLGDKKFASPNPYLARRVFDDCQKIQNDVLYCQILCEIIINNKCRKKQFYVDTNGNYEYAQNLISFLNKHNMGARIYVTVSADDNAEDILDTCKMSNEDCLITPCIFVTNNDTAQNLSEFKAQLSKIYPIGMLTVIE